MSGPAGGPFRRVLSASRVIHIDKNRIVSDVRFSEKKKKTPDMCRVKKVTSERILPFYDNVTATAASNCKETINRFYGLTIPSEPSASVQILLFVHVLVYS